MRRATAWVVVVGVALLGPASSSRAADGFWVSLASGVADAATPTGYQEWWFETPHGPAPVAVTSLNSVSVEATTGGGSSFFNNGAVPVVLHPTDGYAYLTGSVKPSDLSQALKRQMAGGKGMASTTPNPEPTEPPPDANLLSISRTDPDANGARTLSLTLTDPLGNALADGSVVIPEGGWWVIGLGPNPNGDGNPDPGPVDPGPVDPGPVDPGPVDPGPVDPGPSPGPVATPEPATFVMAGLGGLGTFGWRLYRRRRVR